MKVLKVLKVKQIISIIVISVLIIGIGVGVYLVQQQQTIKSKASEDRLLKARDKGPLSKITFIHYKKNFAKPVPDATKGSKGTCYSYIATGAKWKTTEDYIVNPTNSGLGGTFVQQAVDKGVTEWENYGGPDIFGLSSVNLSVPVGANYDYRNTVTFGPYDNDNVIAVTTVWGYFFGVPSTRELVEWDMLFNNDYPFGDASVNGATVMDLQNIATHELGHSAGMGDLYSGSCFIETMFGYSGYGETLKRDLATGDIQGIKKLYR